MSYGDQLSQSWVLHRQRRTRSAPTVVSLFAGCGGSSLGYSIAGFRELLAVERDPHAVATFRRNFTGVDVYDGDITDLSVRACLRRCGLTAGTLDVLDGSPPCQGFSMLGGRRVQDPRNRLFEQYVRLLRGLRPRVCVLENVPGLVAGAMRFVFAEMLRAIRDAGYDVAARRLNAMHYSVPQSRRRLIVIGVRRDLKTVPSHPTPHGRLITAQQAVDGVDKQLWRSLAPLNRRIWRRARVGQRGCDVDLVSRTGRRGSYFSRVKVNPYRPAPTLTKGSGDFLHWTEPRSLAISEAKRLTSFPDAFTFEGSFHEQWARIGNCVPPLFMRAIAEHLRAEILAT